MRQGFSHGFGQSPANRHLVEWMADYNQSHPEEERLRFFGFDTPTEMMSTNSPEKRYPSPSSSWSPISPR